MTAGTPSRRASTGADSGPPYEGLSRPPVKPQIVSSNRKSTENIRRCIKTIRDSSFWHTLVEYLESLVPTIESSLVVQGGDATLADVLYFRGRQYQMLEQIGEFEALYAL
jgi:hypothetical protein